MKTIALLISLASTISYGLEVIPDNNFCSAVKDSKNYISGDFERPYPRPVKFVCTYLCKSNDQIQTIKGTTEMTVSTMDQDALNVVCQGTLLKKVPWGYDFDRIQPFYAYKTDIPEIKRWAFQNISLNIDVNPTEAIQLLNLKKDLYTIAGSFVMAGNNGGASTAYFSEAGIKLSAMADQLPENTSLLDEAVARIISHGGSTRTDSQADSLVLMMLSTSAAWRIPVLK